ncbi:hypothetical protein BDW22DRAFT_1448365 [Trametopsis cervina]|nr:hypothetical protein BDW22DRAFT_1448365 [Trametopsis cervina]
MHNLYLGELRHHCMEVLGIDITGRPSEEKATTPHTPAEQLEWLQKVIKAMHQQSESALMIPRKGYLVAVADLNSVYPQSFTKRDYAVALLSWYQTKGEAIPIKIPPVLDWPTSDFKLLDHPSDLSQFRLISADVLVAIREDIQKTVLPSWMAHPPRNFGSPSHGKLKADQWRTVTTISMVITLVRIWGSSTASGRERDLLENFLHLVVAVEASTSKIMSKERAEFFDHHMYAYLVSLRELFDHDLVPNHHLALHLRECMEMFGPVHSWWAFPFERYNGVIAKLNTNNKSAEMPVTFMRYFCIGANLRAMIASMPWPEHEYYEAFSKSFNHVIGDALRGLPGIISSSATDFVYDYKGARELPLDVYSMLLVRLNAASGPRYASAYERSGDGLSPLNTQAQYVNKVAINGLDFATDKARRGARSSYVLFQCLDPDSGTIDTYPGQIQEIFYHIRREHDGLRTQPFFIIHRYSPLTADHQELDIYRLWPGLYTALYYNVHEERKFIVCADEIVSHFAAYIYTPHDIARECILVRSLNRVRGFVLLLHCHY